MQQEDIFYPLPLRADQEPENDASDIPVDFGIQIPEPSETDINQNPTSKSTVDSSCSTYPWPNMEMFLTDMLFSSTRLRFSNAQKSAILSWAHELHAKNIPTLSSLERCQKSIRTMIGNPTQRYQSTMGDLFYLSEISEAIAKDFSNPLTRSMMQDYPEDGGNGMSQVFHGSKLL
ncbi:hypothetical protein FRC03_007328 [Tulasnella sp. 419]|nr:hypothetical protein FRC03_007328 [Tulasnella sp. 419]